MNLAAAEQREDAAQPSAKRNLPVEQEGLERAFNRGLEKNFGTAIPKHIGSSPSERLRAWIGNGHAAMKRCLDRSNSGL
ncbi:uncharacterized protein PSANT_02621 [Moesziomyces antarcticus]|uniref:Uncharacterized protein n=1 Tax=Pseudozyma antarctica TaxID=84753 RepID=A0A5C3FMD0_PSEA2|nr:uncharacterized protein PSANT_02621 [Moesziomyces antarcticus]